MTSAEIEVRTATSPWQVVGRPRSGFRFTAIERKYLLVFVDLFLANTSLLIAVTAWNNFGLSLAGIAGNFRWFAILTVVWLACNILFDNYNLVRAASTTTSMLNVGPAALLAAGIYLAIPYVTPAIASRTYLFGLGALCVSTALAWRVVYARVLYQPSFARRVLVLGTGEAALTLVRTLDAACHAEHANPFRGTGYQVIGLIAEHHSEPSINDDGLPILGELDQLTRLARIHEVDEIVVALQAEELQDPGVYEALLDCRERGLTVSPLATVYESLTARLPVNYAERDLRVLLGPADSPSSRFYVFAKRLLDIVLAVAGLFPLAVVLPWVALANAIWSPGPLFYRQQRVGQGGRPFAMRKFRSMVIDAEKTTGAVWAGDWDPRITPAGRWLRRSRLDELPQFLNVLSGEMSMVGPRPERPHFVGQLASQLPLYRARHAVKPGITGWAQIRYEYGNSIEDSRLKLEYDLYYVKHASLTLDLMILLQTVPAMILLRGK